MLVFHAHFENCKEKCCRNKKGLIEWEKDKKKKPANNMDIFDSIIGHSVFVFGHRVLLWIFPVSL